MGLAAALQDAEQRTAAMPEPDDHIIQTQVLHEIRAQNSILERLEHNTSAINHGIAEIDTSINQLTEVARKLDPVPHRMHNEVHGVNDSGNTN